MKVQDVFTPGDYPEHTYVERGRGEFERRLEHQLRRDGAIISISGPSKSGKSVLVERVVGSEDLVSVYGGDIESVDDLWDRVLDKLGAPDTQESISGTTEESQVTANVGIRSYLFSAGGSASDTSSTSEETIEIYERRGLDDILEVNSTESFVLLVDDFHYINSELQEDIGEAIKQASEEGLRICVALIPHRSDDLIQANPDLQGRAQSMELEYWEEDDLNKIPQKGFDILNRRIPEGVSRTFAKESVGSPHLMQQLCYNVCGSKGILKKSEDVIKVDVSEEEILDVLCWTAEDLDLDRVFDILNGEGITGGTERKMHEFVDGTEGDVYEAILRGIATDPVDVSLDRSVLLDKIEKQCVNGSPLIPSITQALERMDQRTTETFPERTTIEWNDETMVLEIPDPYLIFFLRWSDNISYYPEIEL